MDSDFEQVYLNTEKTHPWFIYRRKLVYQLIKKLDRDSRILEIGCGSGINLVMLRNKGFKNLVGIEPSEEMKQLSRNIPIYNNVEEIKGKFDLILMLDVLEHIKDDQKMLKKVEKLLKQNSRLILTVPAFNFLWSSHDDLNKHYRRYDNKLFKHALKDSSLKIIRKFYWNFFLFLPITLIKILKKNKRAIKKSDIEFMPKPLSRVYSLILGVENSIIKLGLNPFFGISLVAILKKKGSS